MSAWSKIAVIAISAPLAAVPICIADTVDLIGGGTVRGRIIDRSDARIVVDLGYRVLEIPAQVVERIEQDGERPPTEDEFFDLYRIGAGREELTVKENIARVAEAVVQVRTPTGLGSGFVIHPDGYVVTNQHVVSGENEIVITLFKERDGELENIQFRTVRIVALSPHMDVALLKIEDAGTHGLATVPLAATDDLRQGQVVFAVGSPLGLDRTVSTGIVSLTNRLIAGHLFVQTTTEINPGNSGGPLFNLRGEVAGITELKIVGLGLEGLNFAIPIGVLKEFLRNRSAFAFDPRNPNAGFRYNRPPSRGPETGSAGGPR